LTKKIGVNVVSEAFFQGLAKASAPFLKVAFLFTFLRFTSLLLKEEI